MTSKLLDSHFSDLLLPSEILESSPSAKDAISSETEEKHRVFCCELIQEAGVLLRLPQVVMATGQTLAQRFFYRKSLKQFDAFEVAMGALFLAAKVEEKSRRHLIRDFMRVFNYIYNQRKGEPQHLLELGGTRYRNWKEQLLRTERYILKELGFNVYSVMEHPHKFILYYINTLRGVNDQDLAQKAWNYLNDSLRLDFCVRYKAQVIACAAIYMSARFLRIKLSDNPPWWELFDASKREIEVICNGLLQLYTAPKITWLKSLKAPKPKAKPKPKLKPVELKPGLNVMKPAVTVKSSNGAIAPTTLTAESIKDKIKMVSSSISNGNTAAQSSTGSSTSQPQNHSRVVAAAAAAAAAVAATIPGRTAKALPAAAKTSPAVPSTGSSSSRAKGKAGKATLSSSSSSRTPDKSSKKQRAAAADEDRDRRDSRRRRDRDRRESRRDHQGRSRQRRRDDRDDHRAPSHRSDRGDRKKDRTGGRDFQRNRGRSQSRSRSRERRERRRERRRRSRSRSRSYS